MYFDIFETRTHYEYHVSAVRSEVENRQSMSRRIKKGASNTGGYVLAWFNEAQFYKSIRVESRETIK